MRWRKRRGLIWFFFVSLQTENCFKFAANTPNSENNQQEYNDILADIKTWSPDEAIITDIL